MPRSKPLAPPVRPLLRLARRLAAWAALAVAAAPFTLTVSPLAAAAEEAELLWLATGPDGGTYRSVYGPNLESLMHGTKLLYRESAGSAENLALLSTGRADIGFVQADVYALAYQAGETADLQAIGRLSDECLYVAHRVEGRVKSFADLASPAPGSEPLVVAVGPADGGTAATWRWLAQRQPALATHRVDDQFGTLAVNQLAIGRFDAVLWVTDPLNLEHKMLRAVVANDAVAVMPVKDATLLEPLEDGTAVYRTLDVELGPGARPRKVETLCTSALVVMRRDADAELVERVSDLVGLKRDLIAPREPRR